MRPFKVLLSNPTLRHYIECDDTADLSDGYLFNPDDGLIKVRAEVVQGLDPSFKAPTTRLFKV